MYSNSLRYIGVLALLFCTIGGVAQQMEEINQPKVALVLSGGGAKGFAHIGVLKILEQEKIPVDIIVGTSMGGLVGGIYSMGYEAAEIESLVQSLNWENTIKDDVPRLSLSKNIQALSQRYFLSLPISEDKKIMLPQGVMKGQNVINIFCGLAGEVPVDADFSKLPISFACIAADLETGEEVVLNKGFLPSAMYSSMAIPFAFRPSSRNGRLLVDGGIVNNFPADVAKEMGADIIIGVDIRDDDYTKEDLKSMSNILNQLIGFFDKEKSIANKSLCDLIIRPDIAGYSVSSFTEQAVDSLILRGERAAMEVVDRLNEIKSEYGLQPRPLVKKFVKPEHWHITEIKFKGRYHLNNDFLEKTFGLEIPGDYSPEDIKAGIDRMYGLGGFEQIYYYLESSEGASTLHLNIEAEKNFTQNIGFKVNTTDAAAILLNITRRDYKNIIGLISVSSELSVNPGADITLETNKTGFPTVGLKVKAKQQNINVYAKGNKLYKSSLFYASGGFYFYQPLLKSSIFGVGFQEEYFNGDVFSRSGSSQLETDKVDMFLFNAYTYLSFDNMDDFYFPQKGITMITKFSLLDNFWQDKEVCPVLSYKMQNVVPLGLKTVLLFDIYGRGLFNTRYPQFKSTMVGGELYSQYFDYHLPFVGLRAVNITDSYTYTSSIGFRLNVAKSQYATVLVNGIWQGSDMLFRNGMKATYGGGIRYSIKTMLGPLDATLGYSGMADKPTFSANFGFWF